MFLVRLNKLKNWSGKVLGVQYNDSLSTEPVPQAMFDKLYVKGLEPEKVLVPCGGCTEKQKRIQELEAELDAVRKSFGAQSMKGKRHAEA